MVNRINTNYVEDRFFFALSDTTRRWILKRLSPTQSKTPRDLVKEIGASLPSLMKHLRVLKDAGLIFCEKHGKSYQCFRADELIQKMLNKFHSRLFKTKSTGEISPQNGTQEDDATLLWKEYRILRNPVTKEKLLDRYLHLVAYAAIRFSISSRGNAEELMRVGREALDEAVDAYGYLSETKFERFLLSKIQKEFQKYFLMCNKKYKMPAKFLDKGETNISMARFQRIKKRFPPVLKSVSEDEILSFILEGLSERERLVLALHYMENFTLKKIGRILGVTDARVSQIHSQAIKHIEQHFRERLRKETPEKMLGLIEK